MERSRANFFAWRGRSLAGTARSNAGSWRSSMPSARLPGSTVSAADGTQVAARKLLLATGVVDELPDLEGLADLYGISVHHCPYCDAWEWRDRPLAVYGDPESAPGLALTLTSWSSDIVVCTDGRELPAERRPARGRERHRGAVGTGGTAGRQGRVARADRVRRRARAGAQRAIRLRRAASGAAVWPSGWAAASRRRAR